MMDLKLTIALNPEALSAIQDLSAAIRSIGGATSTAASSTSQLASAAKSVKTEVAEDAEEETGPFYWANEETGFFGEVPTLAAYNKLKKKDAGVYRIPENVHAQKVEELREANEAKAAAAVAEKKAAAAAAKKPADKKPAAKSDDDAPSVEDLIAVFSSYLPKDLDAAERKVRHGFVKPLLERFGVAKASELAEEHRALAINLVQRKMAGEDIDPTDAEFEAIDDDGLV
jgi:hypothetical protein